VWDLIFEPIDKEHETSVAGEVCISTRLNPFFVSTGKDLLSRSHSFQRLRKLYGNIYREKVRIRNTYVVEEVESYRQRMTGHVCLGVHKRLGTSDVASNQLSFRMPTIDEVVGTVERLGQAHPADKLLIYLATDENECVDKFQDRFGRQVIFRPDAQRVSLQDGIEVHRQEWGKVGLKEACDVLIDALLLAQCDEVLHLSSNVSTCVGFLNVCTKMTHFDDASMARPKRSIT
jgi:hypothetical protein